MRRITRRKIIIIIQEYEILHSYEEIFNTKYNEPI